MIFETKTFGKKIKDDRSNLIRKKNVTKIKTRGTKPEMAIRKMLHQHGYRYRVNYNKLPGKPDIVLTKYKAVIFINGCYWHAHSCNLFNIPKTNRNFWLKKFSDNVSRDERNIIYLIANGWRVSVIWECAIRKKSHYPNTGKVFGHIKDWLETDNRELEITEEGFSNKIDLSDLSKIRLRKKLN